MARAFLEVVVVEEEEVQVAATAAKDEVSEIHHGDADGHGGDGVQQRLPPRQATTVVSTENLCACARTRGSPRWSKHLYV